jgi:mono/diheme cytochrome c family protein
MLLKIKYIVSFVFILLAAFIFFGSSLMQNSVTNGFVSSAQTLSGEVLFKNNCARCHGEDGTGGKGPNLTTEKKQAKWKDSDEKLIDTITNGAFGMPKFGKKLKSEEIKAIATYVRSLKS